VTVVKSSNPAPGTVVQAGGTIMYTLTFTNASAQGSAPLDYTDRLDDVLDDAIISGGPNCSAAGVSASLDGPSIHVVGQLAPSHAIAITYTVTLKPYDRRATTNCSTSWVARPTRPCAPQVRDVHSSSGIRGRTTGHHGSDDPAARDTNHDHAIRAAAGQRPPVHRRRQRTHHRHRPVAGPPRHRGARGHEASPTTPAGG
jgi:hypothetical protein